jgi:hypothetical protein
MLPERVARILTAAVVLVVLLLFAVLFGLAIVSVWQSSSKPGYNEGFLYAATALATLVGGVMAVAFNVRPPAPSPPLTSSPPPPPGPLPIIHAAIDRLPPALPAILATLYVVVYMVLGLAAVITWVVRPGQTSDVVKNLATTFLGLALPIVSSFFRIQTSTS